MQIDSINGYNNIGFGAIKGLHYKNSFNPKIDKQDARIIEAFQNSPAIKHLAEKFDFSAEFGWNQECWMRLTSHKDFLKTLINKFRKDQQNTVKPLPQDIYIKSNNLAKEITALDYDQLVNGIKYTAEEINAAWAKVNKKHK